MKKRGYYFINTNIDNQRAHSIQILKTVEAINKQGLSIEVVAPGFKNKYDFIETYRVYNIKEKFKFNLLYNFGFSIMSKFQVILYNLSAIIFLISLKIRKKVEYIYSRSELLFPLLFIANIIKIPYFFEIHRRDKNKRDLKIRNWLVKNAKGVVAINRDLKNHYIKYNNKLIVAECGYDDELFQVSNKQFDNNKIILGYAGGLEETHGMETVIKAMRALKDYTLHIFGGSSSQIEKLKKISNKNIIFFGKVNYSEVAKRLKEVDILLLPQLRDDPGAVSSKMYEYFALGKPILASRIPANLLKMEELKNALFYQKDNISEFIEKLNMLATDTNLREIMSQNNIIKSKNYSFNDRAKLIVDFIREQYIR